MDIKLPINPKVRESLARQPYQLNEDGLYKDSLFRSIDPSCYIPDGSAFVLNYERFCAGALTDDQADNALRDALIHLKITHLKVIHPHLDIDDMIMHLLRERFDKTTDAELKDLCVRKRDFDPGHPSGTGFFESLKIVLVKLCTVDAPMAIALGQPKDLVFKQLVNFIDQSLYALQITDGRCPHIRTGFLHHFLIAYPDLWNQANVEPYHFLGDLMIHMAPGRGMTANKAVVESEAGKSLIRHPSNAIPRELMGFTLDYLVSIDPDVIDAKHLLREGTRSAVWMDRCNNLEEGLPILERLLAYGVVHPALKRIDGLAAKLTEPGKRAALVCYANGGDIPTELAQHIVDTDPTAYDQAFSQAKKFDPIQRLADLKWPSDEQLLKLSPKNKRLLLEGDLGI